MAHSGRFIIVNNWDAPSPTALNMALNVLETQAQFDGPQRKVSVRVAEQDGLIYLDLADEFWRCIEIGANGWRIAEDPPVRFRRCEVAPLRISVGSACRARIHMQILIRAGSGRHRDRDRAAIAATGVDM